MNDSVYMAFFLSKIYLVCYNIKVVVYIVLVYDFEETKGDIIYELYVKK